MTKIDYDILKRNIKKLMKEKELSQEKFGELIGMSQSNINKCLKMGDGSRCFTLSQIWKIADYFNTSVDVLLGRVESEDKEISDEDFCKHLMKLVEKRRIKCIEHTASEDVWDFDEYYQCNYIPEYSKREKTYCAFYFQDYIQIPPCESHMEQLAYEDEYLQTGNCDIKNIQINKFLEKFVDSFFKREKGAYNQEVYDIVARAFWDDFIKVMRKLQDNKATFSFTEIVDE